MANFSKRIFCIIIEQKHNKTEKFDEKIVDVSNGANRIKSFI